MTLDPAATATASAAGTLCIEKPTQACQTVQVLTCGWVPPLDLEDGDVAVGAVGYEVVLEHVEEEHRIRHFEDESKRIVQIR